MAFHTAIWFENINTAVLAPITAATDEICRVAGDELSVPALNNLCAAVGLGANMTRCELHSPSLRKISNLQLEPINVAAEMGTPQVPNLVADLFERPIPLTVGELMTAHINQDAGAGQDEEVIAWFGDGDLNIPAGQMRTIRATSATTLVADTWTSCTITLDTQIPAGRYALVGLRARSTGLIAARTVSTDRTWRAGVPGVDAVGDVGLSRFRYGRAGVFCEFEHDAPPTIQCFSASADTAETFFLDIIPLFTP